MARRTTVEFDAAHRLLATGLSCAAVGRELDIPRGTIQRWRRRDTPPTSALRSVVGERWEVHDAASYCYLLGAYLGDGHITHRPPDGWTLRVFCDRTYPAVIDEISQAARTTFPGAAVHQTPNRTSDCDVISLSHPGIGRAFPQHGPGRKHTRTIGLADWQRELTHAHPDSLVRGLIHSDGCRSLNHVRTTLPSGRRAEYEYVRYFFTNHSADIRAIFTEHCELLGVRVTQPNHRNLAVSHRDSVAILEEVVGPKS